MSVNIAGFVGLASSQPLYIPRSLPDREQLVFSPLYFFSFFRARFFMMVSSFRAVSCLRTQSGFTFQPEVPPVRTRTGRVMMLSPPAFGDDCSPLTFLFFFGAPSVLSLIFLQFLLMVVPSPVPFILWRLRLPTPFQLSFFSGRGGCLLL